MFSGLFYTSINQLFSSGPSAEIQDNVSYRGKFMSAVRLWRKRDEEKRVWDFFDSFFYTIVIYFGK